VEQVDNYFLSTFIHELLNAINGINSVAQILEETSELETEEVEESASDLIELTGRATKLINKLRVITNPDRTLSSTKLNLNELTNKILPNKGQIPNSLKFVITSPLSTAHMVPEELFNGFIEPLIYVLLHSDDDAFKSKLTISISGNEIQKPALVLKTSDKTCFKHLDNLNKIENQLVATSRYGFELKMLFYMMSTYGVEMNYSESAKHAELLVCFP